MGKKINKSGFLPFLAVVCIVCHASIALSYTGKIASYWGDSGRGMNWPVSDPKVVIALGMLQPDLIETYSQFSKNVLQAAHPQATLIVLPRATGAEIVKHLQDPKTVGFIFISHTLETKYNQSPLKSTLLLDANFLALPNELLSAATPALRYVAFIGCHGGGILTQYQIQHTLEKIPGRQVVYYTTSSFVTTKDTLFGFLQSGVDEALETLSEIVALFDFTIGIPPKYETQATLTIEAKDIVGGIEPRYVLVNGTIVGILGANKQEEKTSDFDQYQFSIYDYIFSNASTQKVVIRGSDLSPLIPADDYLVRSIHIEQPRLNQRWEKNYTPWLHLGNDESPYSGPAIEPPSSLQTEEELFQLAEYLKYIEWIDRNLENWPQKYKRFFLDKIPKVNSILD